MNLLDVNGISVNYGDIQALWNISFSVAKGQLVALIGANGAGKTTTLKSLCGLIPTASGTIHYDGKLVTGMPVHKVVDLGITLVPEGRQLFPKMTVEENLLVGAYLKRAHGKRAQTLKRIYEIFPRLEERRTQTAETLSGGEQQMVAIGRALMQDPQVIMFDEPSLGLAPIMVQEVFKVIQELHRQGLTIFLVEQNVHQTLKVADYCYVMENGRIVGQGTGKDLEADESIREAYLGF
ncbi:ABC transporter ATP-binding protein [Geomonas azotofigens]|uniref:ABC transporter ATP-binding protein n=1 Tax=Geomonas azotofigens TaxID=2843196 RepID=UPI001C126535|nr:ABC transporter ATP-binding protein [Geomonas azotofigens]MBU5612152.1 ABC transporter ATP-binding protein [Geomonas azotofigens]